MLHEIVFRAFPESLEEGMDRAGMEQAGRTQCKKKPTTGRCIVKTAVDFK